MTLSKTRYVRFTPPQDTALRQRASEEGCDVVDLIRRATIQAFSLPTSVPISGDTSENHPQRSQALAGAAKDTEAANAITEPSEAPSGDSGRFSA